MNSDDSDSGRGSSSTSTSDMNSPNWQSTFSLRRKQLERFHQKTSDVSPPSNSNWKRTLPKVSVKPSTSMRYKSEPHYEEIPSYRQLEKHNLQLNRQQQKQGNQYRHLIQLMEELVRTEVTYLNNMKRSLEGFTRYLDPDVLYSNVKDLKERLGRGRICACIQFIFANIKKIYIFHRQILLPELQACGTDDVEKIANVFIKLINEDYFYCHVIYAMNYSKAKKICEDHDLFFESYQNWFETRLDIHGLLLQPFERLPRYQVLLETMLKELVVHFEELPEIKNKAAVVSKASTAVKKLTEKVNASMNVSDIIGCCQINLWEQGKFVDLETFRIYDSEYERVFEGHLFLFEKCLVYTENKDTKDKPTFRYRGCYPCTDLSIQTDTVRSKLTVFKCQRGEQQQLEISATSPTIVKWHHYLNNVIKSLRTEMENQSETSQNQRKVHNDELLKQIQRRQK
ncbi:uncharacterized protein DMENIID0001_055350 [Sergentomyia squamirostris]